jgi:hypothetical protein
MAVAPRRLFGCRASVAARSPPAWGPARPAANPRCRAATGALAAPAQVVGLCSCWKMLFTDMSAELPVFTIAERDRDHAARRGAVRRYQERLRC